MNPSDNTRTIQAVSRAFRNIRVLKLPEYELKTRETARGTVVIDLTEAATAWVWTQDQQHWEHIAEHARYPYDCRLRISEKLYTMLQLKF